ncbi:hypothetical protein [Novosphingobium panipatense]|uniref:Uncharacterized protein n=1 Tax=Novosphingobium panipatense TaxID=428991 RepID=A0ABY1QXL1_9SPHN|nr:hypothetical protein [Novosphingobium panipatense]SMP80720.1 hypothetical protein SAMN06296065_11515 [Novosphingobium panipatense]
MSNSRDDCQQDGLHAAIKIGVMALLSLPVFLCMETGALPIGLLAVNHLLVMLGAYAIGEAIARWLRPLRRT